MNENVSAQSTTGTFEIRECVDGKEMPGGHDLCSVSMTVNREGDVELRHLRAFVAVARTLSMTAASCELHITQPALTRTIQQLERVLGVQLFDRSPQHFALTQSGQFLNEKAQRILSDVNAMIDGVRGFQRVRIGFSWALPYPWMTDVVDAFEALTGASIQLLRHDDVLGSLRRGEVDVALSRYETQVDDVRSLVIHSEQRVAAVSKRLPLSGRDRLDWDELRHFPVVINRLSGSTQPELWDDPLPPERIVSCESYDEWEALIAAGRGVGTIGQSAACAKPHPGIVYLPLNGAPMTTLRLFILAGHIPPLVGTFIEIASQTPFSVASTWSRPDASGGCDCAVAVTSRGLRNRLSL